VVSGLHVEDADIRKPPGLTPAFPCFYHGIAGVFHWRLKMKSSIHFNEYQEVEFANLAKDACEQASLILVLETLERIVNLLAQPDIDPSWIHDQEAKQTYEVCMAVLEYARMRLILGG